MHKSDMINELLLLYMSVNRWGLILGGKHRMSSESPELRQHGVICTLCLALRVCLSSAINCNSCFGRTPSEGSELYLSLSPNNRGTHGQRSPKDVKYYTLHENKAGKMGGILLKLLLIAASHQRDHSREKGEWSWILHSQEKPLSGLAPCRILKHKKWSNTAYPGEHIYKSWIFSAVVVVDSLLQLSEQVNQQVATRYTLALMGELFPPVKTYLSFSNSLLSVQSLLSKLMLLVLHNSTYVDLHQTLSFRSLFCDWAGFVSCPKVWVWTQSKVPPVRTCS